MKIQIKNINLFVGELIYNGFKVKKDSQNYFIDPTTLEIEKNTIMKISFKEKGVFGNTWYIGEIIKSLNGNYCIVEEEVEKDGNFVTRKFLNILKKQKSPVYD